MFLAVATYSTVKADETRPVNYLSGMTVYDVTQDSQGYIWFGTNSGLYRFDGLEMKSFSTRDGLPGNEILQLHRTKNGDIWILNFSGIPSFVRNGVIYNHHNTEYLKGAITHSPHLSVFSTDSQIWIASELGPLIALDLALKEPVKIFDTIEPITHIFISAEYGSFITKRNTSWELNPNTLQTTPTKDRATYVSNRKLFIDGHPFLPTTQGLKNITNKANPAEINLVSRGITDRIITSVKTMDGKLLVGTTNDLYHVDLSTNTLAHPLLTDVFVSSLFEDREGNIWVTTLGHGAYLYPVGTWNNRVYTTDSFGLSRFLSVKKVNDYLFVGGIGADLIYIDRDQHIGKISLFPNDPTPQIGTMGYKDGVFLVAGIEEFIYFKPSNLNPEFWQQERFIVSATKDFQIINPDTVLVSSVAGIFKFTRNDTSFTSTNLIDKRTTAIGAFNTNKILIGTSLGLKIYIDGVLEEIEGPLTSEQITLIRCRSYEQCLIGTNGGGLWHFDGVNFEPLFVDDSRLSSIREIVVDEQNILWVGSAQGLFNYDGEALKEIARGNVRSFVPLENEVIYITSGLLTYLPLDEIEIKNFDFSITDLIVEADGTLFDHTKIIGLPKDTENITISLRAPFFGKPDQIKYHYRFSGGEENWISSSTPTFTFRRLPVGNYTISVKATVNGNFIESDIRQIQFRIIPPFWQQAWFVITLAFIGLGIMLFVFSVRIETERKKAAEKLVQSTRMVELEQQALNAMMNPHFVFNVLNSIRFYLDEKGFKQAQEYLTQFSKLIRMQLEGSFNKYIPLSQELERLSMYVNLESLRLRNCLEFKVDYSDVDEDDFEEIQVPALILQPFVENAILHGIQPKNTSGIINVRISLPHNHILEVVIEDNGIGLIASKKLQESRETKKESLAMHLTKERLNLLTFQTGYRSRIVTEERAEGGTRVILQIPV